MMRRDTLDEDARDNTQAASVGELDMNARDVTMAQADMMAHMLLIADRAWRSDRRLQRMMLYDPDIVYASKLRQYMVALLPFQVQPEDPDDPQQQADCRAIEKSFQSMRNHRQLLGHLTKAFWYGGSGASLWYEKLARPITGRSEDRPGVTGSAKSSIEFAPVAFVPVHPDATLFTVTGEVALKVSQANYRQRATFGNDPVMYGVDGPAVKLTPDQRAVFIMNVWGIEPAEWDDVSTAERIYKGQGLRSLLWYAWFNKQLIEQKAATYMGRMADGHWVIVYGSGDKARENAKKILKELETNKGVAVPNLSEKEPKNPLFSMEPSGTGYQIFSDAAERYRIAIVKAILGQELTTGTAPTGLGSGVADAHAATQALIVQYDAQALEDSLTGDFVRPMQRANFPTERQELDYRWSFTKPDDSEDVAALVEAARGMVDMGVRLSASEVRERGGFREPESGEDVIGEGGMGSPDLSDLIGRMTPGRPDGAFTYASRTRLQG